MYTFIPKPLKDYPHLTPSVFPTLKEFDTLKKFVSKWYEPGINIISDGMRLAVFAPVKNWTAFGITAANIAYNWLTTEKVKNDFDPAVSWMSNSYISSYSESILPFLDLKLTPLINPFGLYVYRVNGVHDVLLLFGSDETQVNLVLVRDVRVLTTKEGDDPIRSGISTAARELSFETKRKNLAQKGVTKPSFFDELEKYASACKPQGTTVVISGSPGIGKTSGIEYWSAYRSRRDIHVRVQDDIDRNLLDIKAVEMLRLPNTLTIVIANDLTSISGALIRPGRLDYVIKVYPETQKRTKVSLLGDYAYRDYMETWTLAEISLYVDLRSLELSEEEAKADVEDRISDLKESDAREQEAKRGFSNGTLNKCVD